MRTPTSGGDGAVKAFWPPLVSGIALGLVLLLTFFLTNHGLGASGAATHVVAGTGLAIAHARPPERSESVANSAYGDHERDPRPSRYRRHHRARPCDDATHTLTVRAIHTLFPRHIVARTDYTQALTLRDGARQAGCAEQRVEGVVLGPAARRGTGWLDHSQSDVQGMAGQGGPIGAGPLDRDQRRRLDGRAFRVSRLLRRASTALRCAQSALPLRPR